jgi:RNA polymerase sigma-70 factor (ECF subfamily)
VTSAAGLHDDIAEVALVAAARAGDEDAFRSLCSPYARELHVHCYRMLGSVHDAEDALQETLLRAWRYLTSFEGRSSFRAWLYRVATNVCLTSAARRPTLPRAAPDEVVLSPYPDALLEELPSDVASPAARYDLRESVQLAFLTAIQILPPRQRAVLILRDVLGWTAREVADLLEASTASVNSALQRARATLDQRRAEGRLEQASAGAPAEADRSLLRRYVEAWEAVDIEGLVALLREDAVMTMPPSPAVFEGGRAIANFFATVPADGRLDDIPLIPTRANGRPALAAYLWDPNAGVYRAYGIMVFRIEQEAIAEITGFGDPTLFPLFALPDELPDSAVTSGRGTSGG